MVKPFAKCESRPVRMVYTCWGKTGEVEIASVVGSFWEDAKGERIGFATNWRREPSDLNVTHADGQVEMRRLAPLETIELTSKGPELLGAADLH